jgi:NADPH-dependent 2,4-dienoyl-CoA reductase/sulfur reductase-like enzyme
MTGMEAAYSLAKNGKKVTLVDMLKRGELGAGATKMNIIAIQEMLDNEGIRILDQTRLERITEKGIEVSDANGGRYELPCDTLLLSFGVLPKKDAATAFEGCAADVIKVGDCGSRQATLWNATKTGFDAAMSIV